MPSGRRAAFVLAAISAEVIDRGHDSPAAHAIGNLWVAVQMVARAISLLCIPLGIIAAFML